jgi:phytoene desaturase
VSKRAIVIGSGVAGLSAACRLQAKGFSVTVFEANAYPGGKLSQFTLAGFRFDAGPSLFTVPDFLDAVFVAAGKNPRDYYRYKRLPTTCHYFFEDFTRFHAHTNPDQLAAEVTRQFGVPGERVKKYLAKSQFVYDTASTIFLQNSLHRVQTWLTAAVAKALPRIPFLGIFETMHRRNQRLLSDKRLVQLFDRYATYNGSNPYQAPGILTSIPHLEFNIGTFLPEGGMYTITTALHTLARDLGVQFRFESKVDEIIVTNGKAAGARVGDEVIPADHVVSNMDVYHTYRKLLPRVNAPEKTLAQERSSSALIFYWGIRKHFPELDLHNILFSSDYEAEFKALFETYTLTSDPTVYINITSKHVPGDAPAGCENWFVMINVPANKGQDWDDLITRSRANIVAKINRLLGTDLEPLIACEQILDPRTIEARTSSHQGSLYGTSSNNRFAAFLRHPNFSKHIKNLYFCGGSVHPGGGIPLALNSGKIVSELIQTN